MIQRNGLLLVALAFAVCLFYSPGMAAPPEPSAEHERAVATMAAHPDKAAQVLSHPSSDLEQLDYALFLHVFRPASPRRTAQIRRVLEPVMAAIAKGDQWGMGEVGPFGPYDGSDENMVAIVRAASLSEILGTEYLIPCDVLVRRPALIDATKALYGSTGDLRLPESGCGSRGAVKGFPRSSIETFKGSAERADFHTPPQGTLWHGVWREQNRVLTRMMANPRSFVHDDPPKADYPYENWAYLSLDNYAIAQDVRAKYDIARKALTSHYIRTGMSPRQAKATAKKALFAYPLGAGCGSGKAGKSLRTLIMDGVSKADIAAFIASGEWRNEAALAPIYACAHYGDIEPMAHIAIKDPDIWRMVRNLSEQTVAADRKKLDLIMDVDAPNTFGKTPLMTTAQRNLLASAKLLLDAGANVNATTDSASMVFAHRTALHYAAQSGSLDMIELLIGHGADTSAKDAKGDVYEGDGQRKSNGGLRPIDYLLGRGPVDANPLLNADEREEADKLLSR